MKKFVFLTLMLAMTLMACAREYNYVRAHDPRLAYVGRVSVSDDGVARWTYPGVQIHATFYGTSIHMKTNPYSGFYMVELDDEEPYKIESVEGDSLTLVAEGLADKLHRITITYCMEGLLRLPAFYGFYLDVERTLGRRPELPQRRMEFIGNSITCGYGIEGDGTEKKFSYSQQNIYHTYEAITARAFNAQCQIVARSGIGIYRNNNGNPRGDRMVMPALYPYTQFGTSGERWDFSRYQPDVVCVNLGTNDTTNPRYDVRLLSDAYKRFVRTLRGHYPKAKIVLLTGTMISGQRLADVQRAQQSAVDDAATRGDHEIYRLDFDPADGTYGYGTHRHPSKRQHAHMAEQLIPFIKQITGW
ncbi:MAG: lipase [Prevotella sp.]|nr:lipase [Prevotella sp.]